jgi:hypothetical protein
VAAPGKLMAEWVVGGAAPQDLWEVDIRRFGAFTGNRRALAQRTAETLGLHYAMRWPRQELQSARPLRTSPLHDRLAARGAEFGSKNGWERANVLPPQRCGQPAAGTPWAARLAALDAGRAAGHPHCRGAVRPDQLRQAAAAGARCAGGAAAAVRQPDRRAPGRLVYTAMLNARGGFESDCTVLRLAADRFLVVTGSAQPVRDADWIGRHIGADQHAALTDVSALWSVLSVMGPNARALLAR